METTSKTPRASLYTVVPPACANSDVAGALPPDTTSRSTPKLRSAALEPGGPTTTLDTCPRPVASSTVAPFSTSTPRRLSAPFGPALPFSRRSATQVSSTPASISASAAWRPRSSTVATTARAPGWSAYIAISLRAPPESITPGRSFPGNSSGCSIAPVAWIWCLARTWWSVSPCQTGTRPSKVPSAGALSRISTPAARARSTSSRAYSTPPSASSRPPGSGPSSASTTSAPSSAAAAAAFSPAAPPPITRMSVWRRRYSVRHSRSGCDLRSFPSPAAWRSTFS